MAIVWVIVALMLLSMIPLVEGVLRFILLYNVGVPLNLLIPFSALCILIPAEEVLP